MGQNSSADWVVNKLLSLTWLLWAPRNFWRFTLHTLKDILNFFVIQQKNTNRNIETKLLIIIPINIYTYISINELVEASIGRSSEAVSGPLLFISFEYPCDVSQYVHRHSTPYIHKRIYNKLNAKTSLLCQQLLQNRVF